MLRPAPDCEAYVASVLGAAEASDRLALARLKGFAARTPEQRREVSRKGLAARVARIADPMTHFGFTPAEFADYALIRSKGFSQKEAAQIVLRSRRADPKSGG